MSKKQTKMPTPKPMDAPVIPGVTPPPNPNKNC